MKIRQLGNTTMINPHIMERLAGIHQMLMGAHQAGNPMSASSKGTEREAFIDRFLSQVLTPQFRFGNGDATDQDGRRSGQLDVVVEYPFVPSLPIVGSHSPRLYLAEGIAAVIEVKSDVSAQWPEVDGTISRLSPLRRQYRSGLSFGPQANPHSIPLFVVGYTGWKTLDPLVSRLQPGAIEGILVINSLLFASTDEFFGVRTTGTPAALWAFIACIHLAAGMAGTTASRVPIQYVSD